MKNMADNTEALLEKNRSLGVTPITIMPSISTRINVLDGNMD